MTVTPATVADLAFAEVLATRPRTPARRAAVCLYVASTVPPARSVDAIRDVIAASGDGTTARDALELLAELTATTGTDVTA